MDSSVNSPTFNLTSEPPRRPTSTRPCACAATPVAATKNASAKAMQAVLKFIKLLLMILSTLRFDDSKQSGLHPRKPVRRACLYYQPACRAAVAGGVEKAWIFGDSARIPKAADTRKRAGLECIVCGSTGPPRAARSAFGRRGAGAARVLHHAARARVRGGRAREVAGLAHARVAAFVRAARVCRVVARCFVVLSFVRHASSP